MRIEYSRTGRVCGGHDRALAVFTFNFNCAQSPGWSRRVARRVSRVACRVVGSRVGLKPQFRLRRPRRPPVTGHCANIIQPVRVLGGWKPLSLSALPLPLPPPLPPPADPRPTVTAPRKGTPRLAARARSRIATAAAAAAATARTTALTPAAAGEWKLHCAPRSRHGAELSETRCVDCIPNRSCTLRGPQTRG